MTEEGISPIPREARAYQGHRAGIVSRVLANVVDAVVIVVALAVGYVGLSGLLFVTDPRGFAFPEASLRRFVVASLSLAVVYFTAGWVATGRTYGCHVMGLRVVTRRGDRLGPILALLRAIFCVFFAIGLLGCALDPKRRSVQDLVLGTAVVYDWRPRVRGRGQVV